MGDGAMGKSNTLFLALGEPRKTTFQRGMCRRDSHSFSTGKGNEKFIYPPVNYVSDRPKVYTIDIPIENRNC